MTKALRFDERVAIVTGAGNGLGRAHALLLAERGAMVVVDDLGGAVDGTGSSAAAASLVVDEIRALGGEAVAGTNSVATQGSGEAVVATALEHFGRVDILVNNAGVLWDQTFHKAAPEDVSVVLDLHVGGPSGWGPPRSARCASWDTAGL